MNDKKMELVAALSKDRADVLKALGKTHTALEQLKRDMNNYTFVVRNGGFTDRDRYDDTGAVVGNAGVDEKTGGLMPNKCISANPYMVWIRTKFISTYVQKNWKATEEQIRKMLALYQHNGEIRWSEPKDALSVKTKSLIKKRLEAAAKKSNQRKSGNK